MALRRRRFVVRVVVGVLRFFVRLGGGRMLKRRLRLKKVRKCSTGNSHTRVLQLPRRSSRRETF